MSMAASPRRRVRSLSMSLEGRVLAGRYKLIEQIGAGGMARVYRGVDDVLDRTVAVKVLAPPFDEDSAFVARFEREARAAAGLSHPGVVSVFDTGSEDGIHFIVMEDVEGETLAAVIRQEGPLEPRRAAQIAREVCDALAAAHDKGLVHRDIKPGNVMVTPSGVVKVMDFGIARALTGQTLTRTGTTLGTAAYLSPEQAQGLPADGRSDLYSLGCTLYEMLTGQPPFVGDLPVVVASRHVTEEPQIPSRLRPGVPPALDAVVAKALAKDPSERYQDARAMAGDLSRIGRGLSAEGAAASGKRAERPTGTNEQRTEVLPQDRTPVLPTQSAPPQSRPSRARQRTALVAGVVTAALVVVALVTLFVLNDGGSGQQGPTQPSSPTPSASTSTSPPTPAQALANLTEVVTAGEQADQVDPGAGDDLLRRAQDIVRTAQDGHGQDVEHKFADLQKKVDELASKGKITGSSQASIRQAVRSLGEALGLTG